MKRFAFLTMAVTFVFAAIIMVSCTKEGPAGATGPQGPQGPSGQDGINGTDGTAGCIECHDSDATLKSMEYQWSISAHNAGTAISRSGSASCSPCHSHQGFLASDGNNIDVKDQWKGIDDPVTINCYTCHNIHDTYTPSDLGLTYTEQPKWHVTYGEDVNVDFGKGNLCASCHQSRQRTPEVDMTDLTLEYSGISPYYGPHYSSQANVMGGFGAYEFTGSKDYPTTNGHLNATNTCVSCHMGYSTASMTGGHTMKIDPARDLEESCMECHTGGVADEYYDEYYDMVFKVEYTAGVTNSATPGISYYAKLGYLLEEHGVYNITEDEEGVHFNINGGLTLNGTLTAALFNHRYLYQDHSNGMHNPKWVEALLINSIEAVEALP